MSGSPPVHHATVVGLWRQGRWRGVLFEGPSGAGKSDLALRGLARGWRLVADDRAVLWVSQGRVFARAPERLAGLMEVRHLGILPKPALAFVELALIVACAPEGTDLDRMPEPDQAQVLETALPRIRLFAREASAPDKVEQALAPWGCPL